MAEEEQRGRAPGSAPTLRPGDASDSTASPDPGGGVSALRRFWENPAQRFVLLFLPYLAVAAIAYPRFVQNHQRFIQSLIVGTADLLHLLFDLFSDRISGSHKLLMYDGFLVSIVDECTGIYEVIIFTAAVLAFPAKPGDKLIGIVFGNLIIYAFNILRIVLLILIGRYFPSLFEFMHLYFWQATMILMIASVWVLWLVKVVQRDRPTISAGT
jgi:archaeosortase B (VPXXXP-CTERM-specific)